MRKHLMTICLSVVTVFVFGLLWLLPGTLFEEVVVTNEVGDATVLEDLTIAGLLNYEEPESKFESYSNQASTSLRFNWREESSEFRLYDLGNSIKNGLTPDQDAVIKEYPIWNRPNLKNTIRLQTDGDLEVWTGIVRRTYNKNSNYYLKLVVINAKMRTFETLTYDLQTEPSNYPQLLTFAQPSDTQLKFLVKDLNDHYGEELVEIEVDLTNLDKPIERTVKFDNTQTEKALYLVGPMMADELVAPDNYLFYLSESLPRTSGNLTYPEDLTSIALMDVDTHESEIINNLVVVEDQLNYQINKSAYHGSDLYLLAYPYQNSVEEPRPYYNFIVYQYHAGDFDAVETFGTANFDLTLKNGLFYYTKLLNDQSAQLQVYQPVHDEIVYQADWELEQTSDFNIGSLHVY